MSKPSRTANRNHKHHGRSKSPAAAKKTASIKAKPRNDGKPARADTALIDDDPRLLIVESTYVRMPDVDLGDDDDLDDLLENEI